MVIHQPATPNIDDTNSDKHDRYVGFEVEL